MGKYFTLQELCQSDTAERKRIDNTPTAEAVANMELLIRHILDPLQEAWGKPIRVNSGYRCPALNKAVGGSRTSQHMTGQAADITTGNRADNRRLFHMLMSLGLPFDQLIDESGFSWVHVTHRPDGKNRHQTLKL